MPTFDQLSRLLATCSQVEDAEEETFDLFSQPIPSSNLGFVDSKAAALDLDVGNRSFLVNQSPGLLNSTRTGGTTGAVLWKVTPLVARWLSDKQSVLWRHSVLSNEATTVELGCGISGLIGLALHEHIQQYVLTDQSYVMKTLRQNIEENARHASKQGKKSSISANSVPKNLHMLPFDWEADSAQNIKALIGERNIDLLVACDCIYNDFLVVPFVQACREVCQLQPPKDSPQAKPTLLLVAQQQRSDEVFESWLVETMKYFHVWRLTDDVLPEYLRPGSGYILHVAMVKDSRLE